MSEICKVCFKKAEGILCAACEKEIELLKENMKGTYFKDNEVIIAENRKRYAFIKEMRDRRMTYEDIGNLIGVSRQRVQQIYEENY